MDIRDDGRGFAVPESWIELAREGHLGLAGSSQRAEGLGGRLEIKCEPGEGALLRGVIPYG